MLADSQQRLGVAEVEGMELAELAGQQVARPFGDDLLVDREAPVAVAGEPGIRRLDPGLLARAGAWHRLGPRHVFGAERTAFVRVHRQDEVGRHHRQQGARLFLVGGGHEAVEALAEDQPFLAQEVERLDGVRIGVRDFQPLTVLHLTPLSRASFARPLGRLEAFAHQAPAHGGALLDRAAGSAGP